MRNVPYNPFPLNSETEKPKARQIKILAFPFPGSTEASVEKGNRNSYLLNAPSAKNTFTCSITSPLRIMNGCVTGSTR